MRESESENSSDSQNLSQTSDRDDALSQAAKMRERKQRPHVREEGEIEEKEGDGSDYENENDEEMDVLPQRQRRHGNDDLESLGSDYEPSGESDREGNRSKRKNGKRKGREEDNHDEISSPPAIRSSPRRKRAPSEPLFSSPKKRPYSQSHSHHQQLDYDGTNNKTLNDNDDDRPFKRKKGATFNHNYLGLLNADIQDAAARFVPRDEDGPHRPTSLGSSQIGLVRWTEAEKELFFEALSRLGGHCVSAGVGGHAAEIAARVKTKSELEVAQYLSILAESALERKREKNDLEPVIPADLPAAVELSQVCCNALEEAADAISVRQESHEESIEMRRWGPYWLLTQANAGEAEKAAEEAAAAMAINEEEKAGQELDEDDAQLPPSHQQPPTLFQQSRPIQRKLAQQHKSLDLFRVRNWLGLSERVFMNASFPEYNWTSVSADLPAIRQTALDDFRSIVVSVTRRLVAAVIAGTESRVRTQLGSNPKTQALVRRKDVEAAVLSLGLKTDSREFWARSARRLRLDVFDDRADDGGYSPTGEGEEDGGRHAEDMEVVEEEDFPEPMSYRDVERALDADKVGSGAYSSSPSDESDVEADGFSTLVPVRSSSPEVDSEDEDEQDSNSVEPPPPIEDAEEDEESSSSSPDRRNTRSSKHNNEPTEAAKRDAAELSTFSALGYPQTTRRRKALEKRIQIVLDHEAYADSLDARASYVEEKNLWAMLGRAPPEGVLQHIPPVRKDPPPRMKQNVDDLMCKNNGRLVGGDDWKEVGDREDVAVNDWELEYRRIVKARERRRKAREIL